ncbi:MAG TPA: CusA/CzcA family heavy metal efflux RND transporter [Gemmatimonadales bacterium]|nr:CusA/CzcA family heavy metal efflux RND transporter [Gemmatimonadales bacterium]
MSSLVRLLLGYRALLLVALGAWLLTGLYALVRLDIEAYPDPSPPLVEFITQNPAWSAEEMERQVTVPVETQLFGIPGLEYTRSISLFGLSDVKLYFSYGTDYFAARQEALNRMQLVTLPAGLTAQLSPWSTIGEIYRYRLDGPGYSLNELKAVADWDIRRVLKQVPGIVDVTTFGGTTRQYQAEVDPQKLLAYDVTLPQVLDALSASNANVGGNYLTVGSQSVNVRGVGLLQTVDDMKQVIIAERHGVPVLLGDVADVHEGYQPRLGQVGMDGDDDIVKGTVLLQRGEQSLPALRRLHERVAALNNGLLPPGMHLRTIYDRTDLIHITTRTVQHLVLLGLALVMTLLLVFLGDLRLALITALTIPVSILFAFGLMVVTGNSANLISIGAIDFGILVEAAIVVVENIHRRLAASRTGDAESAVIAHATAEAAKPVLFSTLVILVAFLPLFTMRGVPGKIFAPMSLTYGFALIGAMLFALVFAPALTSLIDAARWRTRASETRLVAWVHGHYARLLPKLLARRRLVLTIAGVALIVTGLVTRFVGGQFMPKLEESDLWVRATLPVDVSFEQSVARSAEIRQLLLSFPAVSHVISQVGRPDDGTDVVTFNNIEFHVQLKPPGEWPRGGGKPALVRGISSALSRFPGIAFGISQNIEDNVEEAMSGVKGENSLKIFGDDIAVLAQLADRIRGEMAQVRGIQDLAVIQETGQPALVISTDRAASARYGLAAANVNAAVQAAVGGQSATQILLGDRHFDFVVRYAPAYRATPEAIRNILLPTPAGARVPLGQVARVELQQGAFMIYRENGSRYIPIRFSVRGRDLASTMTELQARVRAIPLPAGYHFEWAGEYDSLRKEIRRLAVIIPVSLLIILGLLYTLFNSWRDAVIVLAALPFGAIGGVFSLLLTGTSFSISAAVGFTSALGVGTLGGCVFLSGIRRVEQRAGHSRPSHSQGTRSAIEEGAILELRPILMACLAAGLGLLPAAISNGIGAQAQQPLARVVVGAMMTTALAILILIPIFASLMPHADSQNKAEGR